MVVYAYYPLGETRVQREAEALVTAGFAVDVICLRDDGEPSHETYRGVDIYRVRQSLDKRSLVLQFLGYLRFMARAAAKLTRRHAARAYSSVQIHNLPDFLVFSALFPKLRGTPVILDLHDLMPEFFAGRFGDERTFASRLIRWQERLACRFADHVITVSDHWRDSLVARGVPADKVSVVMNVADHNIFRPRARRVRGPEFRLIYHGTVTHRYGLDLAVRATALVREEIPGVRLMIVGDGDLMLDLFHLSRELGLGDHVEFRRGLVLAEELPDLIAEADVGIVPYRNDVFTDGLLPTKLMEYAAMRIPSIASRTTAIESFFRDTMVEFFEPGDPTDLARCILDLYRLPDRREALSVQSAEFTRRYNWPSIGADYVALVQRLAS